MGPMEEFPFPSPGWRHLSLGSNHGVEPVARALTTFHGVIPKAIATAHTSPVGTGMGIQHMLVEPCTWAVNDV